MGKLLGSYEMDEDHDIPELNKCPDCKTYFSTDNCPICGKPCPENMRAGNRPVIKAKKRKNSGGSPRVTFIPWYHRYWFIILMMIISPLIAIIVIATSPHKRWKKILLIVLCVLLLLGRYAGPYIIQNLNNRVPTYVTDNITEEEYKEKCIRVGAEELYRNSESHKNEFVCIDLTITEKADAYEQYFPVYYICTSDDGKYEILIRNCIISGPKNFTKGDKITVYGEMQGDTTIYIAETVLTDPTVNAAYITLK